MTIEIDHQGKVCVLKISGRMAAGADSEYLRTKMSEIKRLDCPKLLVDLRHLQFIGSTGLGFLVEMYTSTTRQPEGKFVLIAPTGRVLEVLSLTRLDTILPIAADFDAGLAFCSAP